MTAIFKSITFSLVVSSETMSEVNENFASKLLLADIAFAESRKAKCEEKKTFKAWNDAKCVYEEAKNTQTFQAWRDAETACHETDKKYLVAVICAQTEWRKTYSLEVYKISEDASISELTIARMEARISYIDARNCYDGTVKEKQALYSTLDKRYQEMRKAYLYEEEN